MKNLSKKVSSTGKGNLVEVKDHSVSSFDAEKFLRKNPNLAVELLLLMATIDMTPSKFFEKIRIVFPGMETTHAEELVLLFLFLRGKSARSTSSEKDDQGEKVHVKKVDSVPASRQAGILTKAKVGSLEDFVGWLGGEKSARKNLPIRIEKAGSIIKLAVELGVGTKKITHWIRKVRSGVFATPLRKGNGSKNSGGFDSGKKPKNDDDVREVEGVGLPKAGKIGYFEDFVEWLGGEEKALDTLSARIKKIGSAANLIRQIKVNEATFYSWVGKLKSRKIESNSKQKTEQKPNSKPEPLKNGGDSTSTATERVMGVLGSKEAAREMMLRHGSLKILADYLNKGEELPITPNNLAFLLKTKFGLIFRDVLKEDDRFGLGSNRPFAVDSEVRKLSAVDQKIKNALMKEVEKIEILSKDQKNELMALAEERKAISLKSLFTLLDDNGEDLPAAAKVLYGLGIIKRNTPADYMPLKRAIFGS